MSGDPHIPRPARARPVADAPLDALIADAAGLARRWAVALIYQRPLEEIGEIPFKLFALQAPPLCVMVVRSLGSDAELERISGQGSADGVEDSPPARTLRALTGARNAPAAVAAVEALRGVLWDALLGELPWPVTDQSSSRVLADLADRLAYVCATILAASLAADPVAATDEFEVVTSPGAAAADALDRPSPRARVVLIDERGDAPARHAEPRQTARARGLEGRFAERGRPQGAAAGGHAAERSRPSETSLDAMPPLDRPDQSSAGQPPATRPRPLPWEMPLGPERPGRAGDPAPDLGERHRKQDVATATDAHPAAEDAEGYRSIRVTRTTPVDGAA
jgi:hypothetical protein